MKINIKKFIKLPDWRLSGVKKDSKPIRDWKISLMVAFFGLIVVAVVHFFVFKKLEEKSQNVSDGNDTLTTLLIDQDKLDEVYRYTENRKSELESIIR